MRATMTQNQSKQKFCGTFLACHSKFVTFITRMKHNIMMTKLKQWYNLSATGCDFDSLIGRQRRARESSRSRAAIKLN